ncbi:hypothetical protein RFI_20868, partial [Reticulomyxa filosa]
KKKKKKKKKKKIDWFTQRLNWRIKMSRHQKNADKNTNNTNANANTNTSTNANANATSNLSSNANANGNVSVNVNGNVGNDSHFKKNKVETGSMYHVGMNNVNNNSSHNRNNDHNNNHSHNHSHGLSLNNTHGNGSMNLAAMNMNGKSGPMEKTVYQANLAMERRSSLGRNEEREHKGQVESKYKTSALTLHRNVGNMNVNVNTNVNTISSNVSKYFDDTHYVAPWDMEDVSNDLACVDYVNDILDTLKFFFFVCLFHGFHELAKRHKRSHAPYFAGLDGGRAPKI